MPGTDALCRWKITCSLGALLHHPLSLNSHFCLDGFGSRWIVLTSAQGAEQCGGRFGKPHCSQYCCGQQWVPPAADSVFCVASSSLHPIRCLFGKVCPCLLLYWLSDAEDLGAEPVGWKACSLPVFPTLCLIFNPAGVMSHYLKEN